MSQLLIITHNADELLLSSITRMGQIDVLNTSGKWLGYVSNKLKLTLESLEAPPYRHHPYLMWMDGYDTLLLKPEFEILHNFHHNAYSLLMSAEKNCWPDPEMSVKYSSGDSDPSHIFGPSFINDGLFIGRRHDVIRGMQLALDHAVDEDDQRAWTRAYTSGKLPFMGLDDYRLMFYSEGDGLEIQPGRCSAHHWNGRVPGRKEFYDAHCR